MDAFARRLAVAHALLESFPVETWRGERCDSCDDGNGDGLAFANDERGLQNLQAIALRSDEPRQRSGRQELDEHLVNQYLLR